MGLTSGYILGGSIPGIRYPSAALEDGLLDLFPAQFALSAARLLTKTYSGPAMKVRRSSDNAVLDIPFIGGVLDEVALLAHTGSGSGYVHTLYDPTGNGHDAIQTTAVSQPRIVNAGVVEKFNGIPAMFFDGVDDYLDSGTIAGGTKPANFSTFSVYTITDVNRNDTVFASANTAAAGETIYANITNTSSQSGKMNYVFSDGVEKRNVRSNVAIISAATQYLDVRTYANGDSAMKLYLDDSSEIAQGTSSGIATSNGGTEFKFTIGRFGEFNGHYHKGYVQEIVVFLSDESTNRVAIRDNINTFFSVFTP